MPWGVAAAAVGAAGSIYSSKQNKKAAEAGATSTVSLDPNMQALLYGSQGSPSGLLQQLAQQAQQGQSAGLTSFGQGMDGYLSGSGANDFLKSQQAAQGLQGSNIGAPQSAAPLAANVNGIGERPIANLAGIGERPVGAVSVGAPSQNNLNLSGAFNDAINGNPAENPYLLNSLKSATDVTNAAFNTNQSNVTNALQRNVLPGLKSNAIASGGFGGSRQGIAEGLALSDYTNQLTNANTQLGAANSANTTGQMANAFNQGEDRSLSALLNLSGQQYGVASQNANLLQQANLANQANSFATQQANTGLQQQTQLANQANSMTAQQFNAGLQQQTALANQQTQYGTNNANLQAQLSTNSLNSQNQAAGAGLSSGLLGQAYGYGQNNSNAGFQRLTQGLSALSPYTGLGASQTQASPYYSNTAGSALGGATAALSLYNQFGGSSGYNAQDIRNTTSL